MRCAKSDLCKATVCVAATVALSSMSISAARAQGIEFEDVKRVCPALKKIEVSRAESTFPLVVTKKSVDVESDSCGIRANIATYNFSTHFFAGEKFSELVAAKKLFGIGLKPVGSGSHEQEWQDGRRKFAKIWLLKNTVFDVVFNVRPEYFEPMIALAERKADLENDD